MTRQTYWVVGGLIVVIALAFYVDGQRNDDRPVDPTTRSQSAIPSLVGVSVPGATKRSTDRVYTDAFYEYARLTGHNVRCGYHQLYRFSEDNYVTAVVAWRELLDERSYTYVGIEQIGDLFATQMTLAVAQNAVETVYAMWVVEYGSGGVLLLCRPA